MKNLTKRAAVPSHRAAEMRERLQKIDAEFEARLAERVGVPLAVIQDDEPLSAKAEAALGLEPIDDEAPAIELPQGVRVAVESVTPELAQAWLETKLDNRPVNDPRVDAYAASMRRGAWRLVLQGLSLDREGRLLDGEHRLWAVVRSGCTVPFLVLRGATLEDRAALDQGRARSIADQLRVVYGIAHAPRVTAWVRALHTALARRVVVLTPDAVRAYIDAHGAAVAFMQEHGPKRRPLNLAPVGAAFLYAYPSAPERVRELCAAYVSGSGVVVGEPAHTLREYVLTRKAAGRDSLRSAFAKALRAIAAHLDGERIELLREHEPTVERFALAHDHGGAT